MAPIDDFRQGRIEGWNFSDRRNGDAPEAEVQAEIERIFGAARTAFHSLGFRDGDFDWRMQRRLWARGRRDEGFRHARIARDGIRDMLRDALPELFAPPVSPVPVPVVPPAPAPGSLPAPVVPVVAREAVMPVSIPNATVSLEVWKSLIGVDSMRARALSMASSSVTASPAPAIPPATSANPPPANAPTAPANTPSTPALTSAA